MSLPSNELLPAAEPATSPFASATDNIQAAARWIVAALAAVGGVLVSSVPLTGLGKFNSLSEFFEAGLGLLVALAAVGFMIRSAARVLTTEYITVAALRDAELPETAGSKPRPVTATLKQIRRNRDELFGEVAEDLGTLTRDWATRTRRSGMSPPPSSPRPRGRLRRCQARRSQAGSARRTNRQRPKRRLRPSPLACRPRPGQWSISRTMT